MTVRAVTPLVQPHGLVIIDSRADHENYDRARDDLAVPDPYQEDFEPVYSHGLIVAASGSAATPAGTRASDITPRADRGKPARARATASSSPSSGGAGSRTATSSI